MLENNEFQNNIPIQLHTNKFSGPPLNHPALVKEPSLSSTDKFVTKDGHNAETTCSKKCLSPSKLATSESGTIRAAHSIESKSFPQKNGLSAGIPHKTMKCIADTCSNQETTESRRSPAAPQKNYLMRICIQRKNRKLFQILNRSTKDCCVCAAGGSLSGVLKQSLSKKYMTTRDSYNAKVINDLIFNESTHVVSVFKDYLIYDDTGEFLKRFYLGHESSQRLPKIYDFYDKYSQVFPNYIALPENKFMFKNIERKQRIIDEQHNAAKKKHSDKLRQEEEKLLDTKFMQEIDKSSTRVKDYEKLRPKGIENMRLNELLDAFISKDTLSLIDTSQALKSIDNKVIELFPKAAPVVPYTAHSRAKSETSAGPTRNLQIKSGLTIKRNSRKEVWVTSGKPFKEIPLLQPQVKPSIINHRNVAPATSRYSPMRSRHATPLGMASQGIYSSSSSKNKPQQYTRPPSSMRTTPAPDRLLIPRQKSSERNNLPVPSNTVALELQEPILKPNTAKWYSNGTIAQKTHALPNMKTTAKRSTSRERNRVIQLECLQEIYYGGGKLGKCGKVHSQRALLAEFGVAPKEASPQKVVSAVPNKRLNKPFKSDFLNTLQKKHQLQYPSLAQLSQRPSIGEKRSLSSSKSASSLKQRPSIPIKRTLPVPATTKGVHYGTFGSKR